MILHFSHIGFTDGRTFMIPFGVVPDGVALVAVKATATMPPERKHLRTKASRARARPSRIPNGPDAPYDRSAPSSGSPSSPSAAPFPPPPRTLRRRPSWSIPRTSATSPRRSPAPAFPAPTSSDPPMRSMPGGPAAGSSTGSGSRTTARTVASSAADGARCGSRDIEFRGGRPVVYVANGSHAAYFHAGVRDRIWPDPNDEADGRGAVQRPIAVSVGEAAPPWMRYRGRWGGARAGWFPLEQSSPRGPAFQGERWDDPEAFARAARSCTGRRCVATGACDGAEDAAAAGLAAALLALAGFGWWRWRRRTSTTAG